MTTLAFFQNIGAMELVIILVIGLLVFGRRLPEVGRSVGKAIVEFKKGVKGIEDEVHSASDESHKQLPEDKQGKVLETPQVKQDDRAVNQSDVKPSSA